MRVGLFIPCYIDDFYPDVALSTLKILQLNGCKVEYPTNQKCCGQPFINNGLLSDAKYFANHFIDTFIDYDYIVGPTSSCIGAVKYRYEGIVTDNRYGSIQPKVYELCEFLYDVIGVDNLKPFPSYKGKVGLHNSCHSIRELKLANPSELNISHYSKIKSVLQKVPDIEIVEASKDECCGFGGTFSIDEVAVSAKMGRDRVDDHLSNGVDTIVGIDSSCLMHMEGLSQKDNKRVRFAHIAQILNGSISPNW